MLCELIILRLFRVKFIFDSKYQLSVILCYLPIVSNVRPYLGVLSQRTLINLSFGFISTGSLWKGRRIIILFIEYNILHFYQVSFCFLKWFYFTNQYSRWWILFQACFLNNFKHSVVLVSVTSNRFSSVGGRAPVFCGTFRANRVDLWGLVMCTFLFAGTSSLQDRWRREGVSTLLAVIVHMT